MKLSHPVLVLGQTRSGTSLLMQMLARGGVSCIGQYPAFEDRGIFTEKFLRSMGRHAVKLIDPWNYTLPDELRGVVLCTRRNTAEQAKSYVKFGRALGLPLDASQAAEWEQSFIARQPELELLAAHHAIDGPLVLDFETVLKRPLESAMAIAERIPGFMPLAAKAAVIARSPQCYPGLLELRLIAAG
jgi:hypothetical protein